LKKLFAIALGASLITLALYAGVSHAISPVEQADIVAHEKLASVTNILKNNAGHFKISNPPELDRATVGKGIQNYVLAQDYDAKKSLFEQMTPRDDFFNFPVLVDGKIVAEFQLIRQRDGNWDVLVGGDLPQKMRAKEPEVRAALDGKLDEQRVLGFGNATVVVARSGSREIGFFPWVNWPMGDTSASLPHDRIYDEESLKTSLSKSQAEDKKIREYNKGKELKDMLLGGRSNARPVDVSQGPVIERLVRYLRYHFGWSRGLVFVT